MSQARSAKPGAGAGVKETLALATRRDAHVADRRARERRPALRRVDESLRRKPLPSVALALVIGFILASLATPAR